jgi:hypothetical protein
LFFPIVTVHAQDSLPFSGFTVIKIGDDPQLMAALVGKAEISVFEQTRESLLIIVVTNGEGYASYRDSGPGGDTCIAWMGGQGARPDSTDFGLGAARYERQGIRLCSEFNLQRLSADRVLLELGALQTELPIVGGYEAAPINWDAPVVGQFTLHGRGLGPVSAEVIASGGRANRKFFGNMENVNLPVNASGAPGYPDNVLARYDAAPAEPRGASHFVWAKYDGRYYPPRQPLHGAFEQGLFNRFGQPSIIVNEARQWFYLWAHDVQGIPIGTADEARERCLMGQNATTKTVAADFRPGVGPSNCGVMLTVTAATSYGSSNTGQAAVDVYRMELFHGRALARRHAAFQMHDIQELRAEIEANIEANRQMEPAF